ncbi:hypothetical protein OROHE_000632 [Orobanche hederae]
MLSALGKRRRAARKNHRVRPKTTAATLEELESELESTSTPESFITAPIVEDCNPDIPASPDQDQELSDDPDTPASQKLSKRIPHVSSNFYATHLFSSDGSKNMAVATLPVRQGCGGVVRNNFGNWELGFIEFIGHSSNDIAELATFMFGIKHVVARGIHNLHVETDSSYVYSIFRKGSPLMHKMKMYTCQQHHQQLSLEYLQKL